MFYTIFTNDFVRFETIVFKIMTNNYDYVINMSQLYAILINNVKMKRFKESD